MLPTRYFTKSECNVALLVRSIREHDRSCFCRVDKQAFCESFVQMNLFFAMLGATLGLCGILYWLVLSQYNHYTFLYEKLNPWICITFQQR